MKPLSRLQKILMAAVVVVVVGAGAVLLIAKKSTSVVTVKPTSITSAPAGLIGASTPNADGQIWLLVNSNGHANVQLQNITSPKSVLAFPVSNTASSVASRFGSDVAVGVGTATTGAVEFYSTVNLRQVASVATSGPVLSVVTGGSSNYYALVRTQSVSSVVVITSAHQVSDTIPLPAGTVSIAVTPDGNTIYALQDSGTVSVVDAPSTKVTQTFPTSGGARQIVLSPDATTLYELKGASVNDNVAVIDVATKSQKYVLPAPASCVAVEAVPSGVSLYDVVGNAQYGNIQVFPTTR